DDGTHYTYENPLESRGDRERWSWHGCPCCPPMLLKAVGELPSYIWSYDDENVWLNLFIDSTAELGDAYVSLSSVDGGKKLTVKTGKPLTVRIRIPSWAEGFTLSLPYETEKGYAVISVPAGETDAEIRYAAPPRKIAAHPYVAQDREMVAVKAGPVLYCREAAGSFGDLDAELGDSEPMMNCDGTVSVKDKDGNDVKLIEYRSWNNHGALPMRVWLRQSGYHADPFDVTGWDGKLYRPYGEVKK
ncbi:MAG: glycoside hydrolase family 127 protein, partial [Clostridia bacterium]|nr:glycoside hydrolase family 127 protein [Clostridia bacterium]